ncbi:MAG TPA: S16 family serine protease, partial [Roseiflexaceae bacterium]|nr:S16 family serine protease [Roseiflexaceae bacterium]
DIQVTDDALRVAIEEYTREAGVRNLEREIANICRKVAVEVARRQGDRETGSQGVRAQEGDGDTSNVSSSPLALVSPSPIVVDAARAREYLGRQRFFAEASERIDRPGIVTGLVWTPFGGDIIFIEATAMPGNRGFVLTGQLGDVMKESARAALSYVRAESEKIGIDPHFYETHDIHMHVPAGAVPKDGPSAGIAMTTALASLLTGRLVKENLAMTGEITLRGKVLPVGGVREKVLAAHRAGIRTVILPKRNVDDLNEIPEEVRRELTVIPVERMEEVLDAALEPRPVEPPVVTTNGRTGSTHQGGSGMEIADTNESVETPEAGRERT